MKFNFSQAFTQEGFGDITNYSFLELGFIYLKYASNPEIKLKKVIKDVEKLRKEASKILRLLDKKSRSGVETEMLTSSLSKISEKFYPLVEKLYLEKSGDRITFHIKKTFGLKKVDMSLLAHPSLHNILALWKKVNKPYKQLTFELLQQFFNSQCYPKENIPHAYPWNLLQNQAWLKQYGHKFWLKKFTKVYKLSKEDIQETNVKERLQHHLQDAQGIIQRMGLKVEELSIENIEAVYKQATKEKKDPSLLADLKTQVSAIKSLGGQEQAQQRFEGKITIEPEFDPLEILQMGNYVAGSCLALDGINPWSAVVNATEVNKRVLWARDMNDNIIARVLIAVDNDRNIVTFPTYYATNLKLEKFFDDYIIELSKKCGYGINGNSNKVQSLLNTKWYTDRARFIGNVNRLRRTG